MTNVITPHKSKYSFQYAKITSPTAKQDPISILDILNKKEWDSVVVTAKITQLNKTIAAGKNQLALSKAVLTDESALIAFDTWEACIKQVSLGGLFTFHPFQVHVWSGKEEAIHNKQSYLYTSYQWQFRRYTRSGD